MRVREKDEFEPWDTKHATEKTRASLPRGPFLSFASWSSPPPTLVCELISLHSRILWEAYSVSQIHQISIQWIAHSQFDFTAAAPWFKSSASPRKRYVPYLPDDLWDLGINGRDAVAPYAARLRDTLIGAERDFENVSAYRPQKISLYCCINTFNAEES